MIRLPCTTAGVGWMKGNATGRGKGSGKRSGLGGIKYHQRRTTATGCHKLHLTVLTVRLIGYLPILDHLLLLLHLNLTQSSRITLRKLQLKKKKRNSCTNGFFVIFSEYTTIKDAEQRRRYKADFNADYAEYRDLHAVVERVSRRFAQLEERLKQEDQSSPGYKVCKICSENHFDNILIIAIL